MACGFYQVMSARNKPLLRAALLSISSALQDAQECFAQAPRAIEFVQVKLSFLHYISRFSAGHVTVMVSAKI
eukprot:3055906-Rhodomonas_salina.2